MTSTLGQPYPVKYSQVDPNPDQPRRYFNSAGLEMLADSIQTSGQEVPIKICTNPNAKGRFLLIDGERRWRAFGLIAKRTNSDPLIQSFIEVIRDTKELFRKSWIANLLREDISPIDEAAGLAKFKENGETFESLALMTGKSITYIENYLKLHTLPDQVKELMSPDRPKELRLTVTAAIDIVRSTKDQMLRFEIANESIERQLNIYDTRTLIQQRTGVSGERFGGFKRKPSDDYKAFVTFLAQTKSRVKKIKEINFDEVYINRQFRENDAAVDRAYIEEQISDLQVLAKKLKLYSSPVAQMDALSCEQLALHFGELLQRIG